MTKEEAINFIIEEAKRGNNQAHRDFCGKYATCKECPLEGDESCRNVLFNEVIKLLLKAEEKQETNLEHYIIRNGVSITQEHDVEVWEFRFKKGTEKQFFDANIKSVLDWLLSPYKETKPKYKLSKFEHDLLDSYFDKKYGIKNSFMLDTMRKKGYFKGVPTDMPIKDVLDNCEVIEE